MKRFTRSLFSFSQSLFTITPELTIPLYKDPSGKANRPFNVTDANMQDTVNVMVEYGGLEAKAKDEFKNYYTNAYLPGGSS